MSKELIDHMTNRFLSWKLPKDFYPDCGISFKPYPGMEPIGTNLLTYEQAKAMFEYVLEGAQQAQAEAVPPTHVLVPVDEPTDEMVDAACAAVDGLCRVDFVRAYVAAFAHLKAGYRDESYWCGWNAAIKFQQAESAHQYNLANRLRVHLANRHTLTGPEFKDGVAAILAEYYAAPQQAEAVPNRAFLERTLAAMEGVIDVADRKTDEFEAMRSCIVDLTLMLYANKATKKGSAT